MRAVHMAVCGPICILFAGCIALAPVPAECIMLYLTVSIYSGGLSLLEPAWWRSLFDPNVYFRWFGPLTLLLVAPWFIGLGIVSIIRRK